MNVGIVEGFSSLLWETSVLGNDHPSSIALVWGMNNEYSSEFDNTQYLRTLTIPDSGLG